MRSQTTSQEPIVPRPGRDAAFGQERGEPPRRSRTIVLTACVLLAIAAVWAFGLGIIDRIGPDPGAERDAGFLDRAVRRPVLFAVHRTAVPEGRTVGLAIPLVAIDTNGALRPPVQSGGSDVKSRIEVGKFVAAYCGSDARLFVLSGGALAGTARFSRPEVLDANLPIVTIEADQSTQTSTFGNMPGDALGITDVRFCTPTSGARPMRARDQAAADQLVRAVIKQRYAGWQIAAPALSPRVRLADLDRSGGADLLVSCTVPMQEGERRTFDVVVFLIGEPVTPGAADGAYNVVFTATRDMPPDEGSGGYEVVDQVDLSPAPVDEIVVRSNLNGLTQYAVLQRSEDGWREVYTSGAITPP